MKRFFVLIYLLFLSFYGQSQDQSTLAPRQIQIDLNNLVASLSNTVAFYADESRPNINLAGRLINFTGINGTEKGYRLIETPVLSKEYSKDHPEFKSYTGLSVDGKTQVKISITPAGLTGVLIEAGKFYYIEKSKTGTLNSYDIFDQSQIKGDASCGFNEVPTKVNGKNFRNASGVLNTHGSQLRNYRMAIACTGEFTAQNGGTKAGANARINALLTLINARYETELASSFVLAAGNDNIVFTDSTSDFFTPGGGADPNQSQSVFTNSFNTSALMPYANYDIGQTLHYQDNPSLPGGFASASGAAGPTPCQDNSKARSWTQYSEGTPGDANTAFLTGIIVHEMGHQFETGHTFTGSGNNCNPGTSQFTVGSAYEPGSGNTIMSYNGICGSAYNLTGGKVDYFHARSLFQISSSLNGTGGSCITPTTNSGNSVPTANAGIDHTIPKSTPFVLNGTGTDSDVGDILTYTWDQYDQPVINDQGALGTINGVGGYNAINSVTAPLFRTAQSSTGERTFPALSYILNNSNVPANNEGEALSAVARDINMRLVVRDNKALGGAYDTDDVKVTVANSGPFEVTTGNGTTLWFVGENRTINWNVNGTNAAPVNCANVKISTSTDGGNTFTTLVASTPNDGSYPFTVPNTPTSQFRIKIEAVGNIFFDINNENITLNGGACAAPSTSISNNGTLTANQGLSTLNMTLLTTGTVTSPYEYIFVIWDVNSGNILDFQIQPNLTSYAVGNYRIYGISYASGTDFSSYINTSFTSFQTAISNNDFCGMLSSNFKNINIIACPSVPATPVGNGTTIDPGNTATLTASGCSGTYNWYASAASASTIGTGPSFTTPILNSTTTYFVSCLEVCESERTSVIATVINYCSISQNCGYDDEITNVTLTRGGIDIINQTSTNCVAGGYTLYDNSAVDITQGETISYSITKKTDWPDGIAMWIDFNRNGIWTDSGELIFSNPSDQTPTFTGSFTVPVDAAVGNIRIRVKIDFNANTSDPCLAQDTDPSGPFGEVEDYLVNIVAIINCQDLLTLTSPTNDITSGTSTFESNNDASGSNPGLISATNKITGGNTTFSAGKKVEMNPGFEVNNGAVFSAKIGGCSN